MKTKLLTLYSFPIFDFALMLISISFANQRWLVVLSTAGAMVVSIVILQRWMSYVKSLLLKSNSILNKQNEQQTWSFDNLDLLSQNQDQVEKKLLSSAEIISNLAHPEKLDSINNLDTTDPIGKALHDIKAEMQSIKEENEQREWITRGVARFTEVLRKKTELKEYSNQIISHLIKYLNANQGALFVEYENSQGERFLELTASYAYGRRKYRDGKVTIAPGEGLLGECMLEKDYIYITNVPKDYIKITSGIGEATPRNVIIAPLIFNQQFYGAIELASFEILKPHQMHFLKEVCENIASEIAGIKHMEHTQSLLEESTALTNELQAREEEMKKNMDELNATQKEMANKQLELNSYLEGINNTVASAEFAMDGAFKSANEIFLKVLGYSKEELSNQYFDFFMGDDPNVTMMWENLRLGKFFSGEFKMKSKCGKELWLTGTFNPITTEGNVTKKIMMFAQFTTQEKEKLDELNAMVHALKHTLPVIEFNSNFVCKAANEKALKIFGLSRMQLRSKTILDFIAPFYHPIWNDQRSEVLDGDFSSHTIPFFIETHVHNYEVSISVTRNTEGQVMKVIILFVKEANEKVLLAVG